MIRLYDHTRIYVMCPARYATGGTESLHALVHTLRDFGHDVKMVYLPRIKTPTPYQFADYYVEHADSVNDNPENVLIVPEVWTQKLNSYNAIQKAIWWLSVDFHVKRGNRFCFTSSSHERIIHFYQSKYVEDFLSKTPAKYMYSLNAPLNQIYLKKYKEHSRENNVLYNPTRGMELTKRLMNALPSINWVAIKNMDNEEVAKLMRRSKVYVDFGPFPGRERIPREAAICGCCVIVGMRGAARFHQDVPIPKDYKFSVRPLDIERISAKIRDCVDNHEQRRKDFGQFRREILAYEERFNVEIKALFGQRKTRLRQLWRFRIKPTIVVSSKRSVRFAKKTVKKFFRNSILTTIKKNRQQLRTPR